MSSFSGSFVFSSKRRMWPASPVRFFSFLHLCRKEEFAALTGGLFQFLRTKVRYFVSVNIRNFRRRSRVAAAGHHRLRLRPPSKAVPGAAAAPRAGRLSTETDRNAGFHPCFCPDADLEDSAMRYDDLQQHRTAQAASIISITRGEQLPRGAGRDVSWRERGERQARRGWRTHCLPACLPRTTLPLPNPLFRQSIRSSSWRWCGPLRATPPAPTMPPRAILTDRAPDLRPLLMEENQP